MFRLIFILIFCLNLPLSAQPLSKLLVQAKELHKQRSQNIFSDLKDTLDLQFDSTMQGLIQHPEFCAADPTEIARQIQTKELPSDDSGIHFAYHLMNFVTVAPAEDLAIFSWDDLGGGSAHSYTNYIQYRLADGTCMMQPLDTARDDWEVGYYEAEKLQLADRDVYALFGYGSYGGGHQHRKVTFLERLNDALVERTDFYPDGKKLTILSNRGQDPRLTFDAEKLEIRYLKYVMDEDVGFFKNEAETIILSYAEGKLVKK